MDVVCKFCSSFPNHRHSQKLKNQEIINQILLVKYKVCLSLSCTVFNEHIASFSNLCKFDKCFNLVQVTRSVEHRIINDAAEARNPEVSSEPSETEIRETGRPRVRACRLPELITFTGWAICTRRTGTYIHSTPSPRTSEVTWPEVTGSTWAGCPHLLQYVVTAALSTLVRIGRRNTHLVAYKDTIQV